ncbi:MAG TPA: helix-turn-helix transcriptional regulator [Polyangiales bacterium]
MDHRKLAAEWLRALRGKRSQRAFAQRLGYRSNVLSRWESGSAFPTAAEAMDVARQSGVDVRACLQRFFRVDRPFLQHTNPCRRAGMVALLTDLRGATPIQQLARQTGYTRFQISRWLSGHTEPRLPDLFALVDALSLRLPEFVHAFVDAARLPTLAPVWQRLTAAREAAFARPWSHAVLRALELREVCALRRHPPGFIAHRLGISLEEEQACLALLARAGQVKRARGRWLLAQSLALDLRSEPERLRALKAFWLSVADARLQAAGAGTFAFNVFAVAERDLAALQELHLEFYRQMALRIDASTPSECVVLYNAQLLRLDQTADAVQA